MLEKPKTDDQRGTQRLLSLAKALSKVQIPATNSSGKQGTILLNSCRPFKSSTSQYEHPHDHRKLWLVEKAVSGLMVPVLPLALLVPNKILDSVLAMLICSHAFWGLEALVVEYARVIIVGPLVPKLCMAVVYALTLMMLGGLYYLIFNGCGMTHAFFRIWKNMRKDKKDEKTKK